MEKTYISIEKSIYNNAVTRLANADMPRVRFRKDDHLQMANDAIQALRQEMTEIAILLQSGNKDV